MIELTVGIWAMYGDCKHSSFQAVTIRLLVPAVPLSRYPQREVLCEYVEINP